MPIDVPKRDRCPFCLNLTGVNDCVFVHRNDRIASFINPRQLERGAVLITPVQHVETVLELQTEVVADVYTHAQELAAALVAGCGAKGVNIFQNNGVAAGQSVPHYHVHVVPRYEGSDPTLIFREDNYEIASVADREEIGRAIRAALSNHVT